MKLQYNNRTILTPSRDSFVAFVATPTVPEWQTFTCLSYFMRLSDLGLSGTNFRYYNKGEATYSAYNDNPSRFSHTTSSTSFGNMNTIYVGSAYAPGNFSTYQFRYNYTAEDLNNLIDGNGLQIEIVYMNTSTSTPGGNYARYWMSTFPGNLWNSGNGYQYTSGNLDFEFNPSSTYTLGTVNAYNNWSYGYYSQTSNYRARRAKNTNVWHHLVVVISKKNNCLRIWDNGILSINATLTWNKTDAEIRNTSYMLNANLANLPNMYVSQLGVREAVWTEAKNYDPPTAPYLSTSEYF